MGRLGYSLLTLGLAFVWLGWYYHAEWATVPGLVLLAFLTVLALLRVDASAFELTETGVEATTRSTWLFVAYFAFYIFAVVAFFAAVAHTQAGGDGVMTAATFVVLGILLAMYDFLPWETLRARTAPDRRSGA